MKRILSILLTATLLLGIAAAAAQADPAAEPRAVIELLYQGKFQQVFDQSSADVQTALGTADGLAAVWAQVALAYGAFEGITAATAEEQNGMTVGQVTCAHANADITYTVAVLADHSLAGLTVSNVVQKAADSTADATTFVSEPITLRAGEADETQGLLTLPVGDGPFPAVLMMQGSGPSDLNETAFGITPFRDLAEGLAQAGIASVRYDKYTYAHEDLLAADANRLAAFTVADEYITDARDALALLKADPRIGNLYLLGHSLGAMMIPRVMQTLGAENFKGGVMLSGSPLPLWELQYHQNLALIPTMTKSNQESARIMLDNQVAKLTQLRTMTDEELQGTTFFGISAYYQMDQMSVDPVETAVMLGKPLLIAQGGKDWQVTPADGIEAWQAALAGQLAADYKLYPDMHHMLCDMDGDPAGDTTDYQAGSTVSPTLIRDIAAWILGE